MSMTYTLPLPPPLNALYRTVRGYIYKTREARDWEALAFFAIKKAGKRPMITTPVIVELVMYLTRDRDIDSCHKLVLDTLEKARVYKNDKQVVELHTIKADALGQPRMEVSITEAGT